MTLVVLYCHRFFLFALVFLFALLRTPTSKSVRESLHFFQSLHSIITFLSVCNDSM
jgi:hypothetical protein